MEERDEYLYKKGYYEGYIEGQKIAQDILSNYNKLNTKPTILMSDVIIDFEETEKRGIIVLR